MRAPEKKFVGGCVRVENWPEDAQPNRSDADRSGARGADSPSSRPGTGRLPGWDPEGPPLRRPEQRRPASHGGSAGPAGPADSAGPGGGSASPWPSAYPYPSANVPRPRRTGGAATDAFRDASASGDGNGPAAGGLSAGGPFGNGPSANGSPANGAPENDWFGARSSAPGTGGEGGAGGSGGHDRRDAVNPFDATTAIPGGSGTPFAPPAATTAMPRAHHDPFAATTALPGAGDAPSAAPADDPFAATTALPGGSRDPFPPVGGAPSAGRAPFDATRAMPGGGQAPFDATSVLPGGSGVRSSAPPAGTPSAPAASGAPADATAVLPGGDLFAPTATPARPAVPEQRRRPAADEPEATHDPHEVTVQLDAAGLRTAEAMLRQAKGKGEEPDGPVFVDESGRRGRTFRRLGALIGLACAVYAVVIVATLLSGSSDAPWLPVPGQEQDAPEGKVDTSPAPSASADPSASASDSPAADASASESAAPPQDAGTGVLPGTSADATAPGRAAPESPVGSAGPDTGGASADTDPGTPGQSGGSSSPGPSTPAGDDEVPTDPSPDTGGTDSLAAHLADLLGAGSAESLIESRTVGSSSPSSPENIL
ncbi:hypothetical protein [Streptomyces minutiscleroticus]|uniref:hypothetical protein n=1 Tax=Streptomyces minutiscleroticus TaxID=68238 RepID=UPI00331903B9